jgi:hypothetical protein
MNENRGIVLTLDPRRHAAADRQGGNERAL